LKAGAIERILTFGIIGKSGRAKIYAKAYKNI